MQQRSDSSLGLWLLLAAFFLYIFGLFLLLPYKAHGAEPDAKTRASIALQLAQPAPAIPPKHTCDCLQTGRCDCTSCACPGCPFVARYDDAYRAAVQRGAPLLVSVGACRTKPADYPGYVLHHTASFQGVPGSGVVLAAPAADGTLDRLLTLPGAEPDSVSVHLACQQWRAARKASDAAPAAVRQPIPYLIPAPSFGGFGGRSSGGCAGGH